MSAPGGNGPGKGEEQSKEQSKEQETAGVEDSEMIEEIERPKETRPDVEVIGTVTTYAQVANSPAQEDNSRKAIQDVLRIVLKKTEAGASYHLKDKERANLVFVKLGVPRENVIGIEMEDFRTVLVTTNTPAHEWRVSFSIQIRSGLITLPMRMFKRLTKVTIMGVGVRTDPSEVIEMLGHFGTFEDNPEVREKTYFEKADLNKLTIEERMMRGVKNGDREVSMYVTKHVPSFALLPSGKKVRVRYAAQPITCARCHQGMRGCKGGGHAAKCEKKGGAQVALADFWKIVTGQTDAEKDANNEKENDNIPEVQASYLRIEGLGKNAGMEWVKDLLKPSITVQLEDTNFIQTEDKLAWLVTGLSLADINSILQLVSGTQFKGKTVYCTPVVSDEIPKPKVSSSPDSESGTDSGDPDGTPAPSSAEGETPAPSSGEGENGSEQKTDDDPPNPPNDDEYEKVRRQEKSAEKKKRAKEKKEKKEKEEKEEREVQKDVKSPRNRTRSKRTHKDVILSPEAAAERSQKKGKQ